MMFQLGQCAKKSWHKLHGSAHLTDVTQGVDFITGIKPSTQDQANRLDTRFDNNSELMPLPIYHVVLQAGAVAIVRFYIQHSLIEGLNAVGRHYHQLSSWIQDSEYLTHLCDKASSNAKRQTLDCWNKLMKGSYEVT